MRLRCENVQCSSCLTQFHGMSITSDKLRSLVRKWQSLIEGHVEVKTQDGYVLRMFIVGSTRKTRPQTQKTAYAQSQQFRQIRKRMMDTLIRTFSECDVRGVVEKLQSDSIGKDIIKQCSSIYPLKDVTITKVKVVKAPKMDAAKLLEAYNESDRAAAAAAETAGQAAQPVSA